MVAALSPLRHPGFRALWLGSLASFLGTWVHNTAARWTATELSGRPSVITAVDALQLGPMVLFSVLAGRWADRHDRRTLLLWTHAGLGAAALALALSDWSGHLDVPTLLALSAVLGTCSAWNGPAWQATVPRQVPDAEVPRAVALLSTGFNLARAVGPALGSWMLLAAGPGAAFAANALSYLVVAALIARLPPQPAGPPRAGAAPWALPALRGYYAVVFVFGFCANPSLSLAPLVARDGLGGGVTEYGRLLTGFGLGAAAAGLLVALGAERLGRARYMALSTTVAAAGMFVLAHAHLLAPAMAGAALCGAGWIGTIATANGAIQLGAPANARSEAMAWFLTAAVGGQALGAFSGGQLAERWGVAGALEALGLGLAALATAVLVARGAPGARRA